MNHRNFDQNGAWFQRLGKIVDPFDAIGRREPTPSDVLFGRGRGNQKHAGNIEFLHKIEQNLDLYHQQKRGNKQKVVAMVVEWVHGRNGSFLKQTFDGNWIEADEPTARMKVSQAFRHGKLRLQDSSKSDEEVQVVQKKRRVDTGVKVDAVPLIAGNEVPAEADGVSSEPCIIETKLSPMRALPGEIAADPTAKRRRTESSPKAFVMNVSPNMEEFNSTHTFRTLLTTTAIAPYPKGINLQPFVNVNDTTVFNKLPSGYNPSQPKHSVFLQSPSREENMKMEKSSLRSPSGPERPNNRHVSDDVLVSAEAIFDAIKTWEAQGTSQTNCSDQ